MESVGDFLDMTTQTTEIIDYYKNIVLGAKGAYVIVLDVETTQRQPPPGFSADPAYPDNKILMFRAEFYLVEQPLSMKGNWVKCDIVDSYASGCSIQQSITFLNRSVEHRTVVEDLPIFVVGHNVKFDMHYLVRAGFNIAPITGLLDTQSLYHVATGLPFASLDEVALDALHGNLQKIATLRQVMALGKTTEQISGRALHEYLVQDVLVTAETFRQLEVSPLSLLLSRTALAVFIMELNGIYFDPVVLRRRQLELAQREVAALADITKVWEDWIDWINNTVRSTTTPITIGDISNLTSSKAINIFLGLKPLEITRKTPMGNYKNGNPKIIICTETVQAGTPKEITEYIYKYYPNEITRDKYEASACGYPMTATVLQSLINTQQGINQTPVYKLVSLILDLRKVQKLQSTYITNLLRQIDSTKSGGHLHPNYNLAATPTGRLSCTRPNAQNFPEAIEELLEPPPNTQGYGTFIMKADFKQLEMVACALVTHDPNLIRDLVLKEDIHDNTAKAAGLGGILSPAERRRIKSVNFGLIYGGGVATLAEQSGLSIRDVRAISVAFKRRYGKIFEHYKDQQNKLEHKEYPSFFDAVRNEEVALYSDPNTGRVYRYTKSPGDRFRWNEICNYPIQGLATGDIVPIFLGVLLTTLELAQTPGTKLYTHYDGDKLREHRICLQRTIHDSVELRGIFEPNALHPGYSAFSELFAGLKTVMDAASFVTQEIMEECFNIDWLGLKLVLECEIHYYKPTK